MIRVIEREFFMDLTSRASRELWTGLSIVHVLQAQRLRMQIILKHSNKKRDISFFPLLNATGFRTQLI